MIELKNVTKIYKGKYRKKTQALRGVSFNLPEKGMVFVVGRSGCGKSTLLNLIGGGDRFTKGDIIVDGNPMSAFTPADFDKYRNTEIGFIYQDFCLLDALSVRDNVALAIRLQGEEDDKRVETALALVGLSEKAKSAPTELSGGQRQRVAIARVLAKDAKYVLADEPTGNLDSASSRTVLNILKELSKTRLVLIVSHNRADADEFADRILELDDGRIVSDLSRDPNAEEISFLPGKVVFQRGHDFTKKELGMVSRALNRGGRLCQTDTRFLPTVQPAADTQRAVLKRKKLSRKGFRTIFRLFFKKRWVSAVIAIVSIFFMVVVLGVSQFFTQFDASREIRDLMAKTSSVITMQKTEGTADPVLDPSPRFARLTEKDKEKFEESGADVYPIYGVSMQTMSSAGASGTMQSYLRPADADNYKFFYCKSGLGVMQTTEEYLARLYGKDGKLNVLSGELGEDGVGIIVTDYFADSILQNNQKLRVSDAEIEGGADKYANITTGEVLFSRYRVRAVIATGYTERYGDILENVLKGESIAAKDKELVDFYEELDGSLNLGYTFNPHFGEEFVEDTSLGFAYYGECHMTSGEKEYTSTLQYVYKSKSLKPGEILIREDVYRSLMGGMAATIDWDKVKGTEITLSVSDHNSKEVHFEKTFKIMGKVTGSNNAFAVAPEDYGQFLQYSVFGYAVAIDGGDVMKAFGTGEELGFKLLSPKGNALYTVARAAAVFIDLFELIIYMMLALTVVTLLSFSIGSIKKCIYEIGVLRAQGARTRQLVAVFALQQLLVGIIAAICSILGLFFGSGACNVILGEGFAVFSKNAFMREVQFIRFIPGIAILDVGLLLLFSVVSIIIPLLFLRRVKPREIIRAKE